MALNKKISTMQRQLGAFAGHNTVSYILTVYRRHEGVVVMTADVDAKLLTD